MKKRGEILILVPSSSILISYQIYNKLKRIQNMEKKCHAGFLKEGEIVSRISYLLINKVHSPGNISVSNTEGVQWRIDGEGIIESEIVSSEQFDDIVHLPKSKLARAFVESPGDTVFTISFNKKDGSERRLVGVRTDSDQDSVYLGLSQVIDMNLVFAGEKNPVRNIYHDQINWFICKGTKYVLKG